MEATSTIVRPVSWESRVLRRRTSSRRDECHHGRNLKGWKISRDGEVDGEEKMTVEETSAIMEETFQDEGLPENERLLGKRR